MAGAHGVVPWLAGLAVVLLLFGVACVYWPLRFEMTGRARGEPDGSWVVGGGVSLAAVSVALVWARGIAPQVSFLVFGHKLEIKPNWGKRMARPVPQRVKAASRRAFRRVDLLNLALKLLEERRHLRVRYLVLELAYGFRDPVLTGQLVGAISALSAVLPPPIEIRQAPRWDFEDSWEVSLDSRAVVKPWLMLLDTGVYVVRQMLRVSA
jgi:hypothetical protein